MTEVLTPRTLGGLKVLPVQQRSQFLNILVYGETGTGKTRFAGSADELPELRPVLVVDMEAGTETLRHCYPKVDQVRVSSWKEMQLVYDELHKGKHDYQTVVLDSLTEIQKFNMYDIMHTLIREHPERDPDVPSMREWGKSLEQTRRFVRAFRDLPMNSIFTALEKQDKNPQTGKVTILPSLPGKAASEIAAFLDLVLYYYVKRVGQGEDQVEKRLMLTKKTDGIVAKDRTDKLPMIVTDPTLKTIYDYFTGKLVKPTPQPKKEKAS
jgi:hypothetical protein